MKNRVFILDSYLYKDKLLKNLSYDSKLYKNIKSKKLIISPLSLDWNSPLPPNHYRSGCAPLEALSDAIYLLQEECEVIQISGRDFLRTEYTSEDRRSKMNIYGEDSSLPKLYTELANLFLTKHSLKETDFIEVRDLLYQNYLKTYNEGHPSYKTSQKWLSPITSLFRGVDCANPTTDVDAKLILVTESFLKRSNIKGSFVEVIDCKTKTTKDGAKELDKLSNYDILEDVFLDLEKRNSFDLKAEIENDNCLLDIYTCFPIVPLAFLYKTHLANSISEVKDFIKNNDITIDGGMNLSKAPWNNPCLLSIINAKDKLLLNTSEFALIHGNGGLGYKQGIALLKRAKII